MDIVSSDKWLIQGNQVYVNAANISTTYPRPFKDLNYSITSTGLTSIYGNTACHSLRVDGCSLWTSDDASFNAGSLSYIAQGFCN